MIWRQLFALLDLRIKLSRNQQLKAGSLNFYLSRILFVLLWISTVSSFVATAFGGAFFFRAFSEQKCITIWCVAVILFLFYWAIMLVGQLQQTETISFEKILHLPVSFRGAFLLNYFSSYANSAVWMGAPILFGLSIGMWMAKGSSLAHLLPATVGLFVCVTAFTYQFRGWFSQLIKNKRFKSFAALVIPLLMVLFFSLMFFDSDDVVEDAVKNAVKQNVREFSRTGPSLVWIATLFLLAAGSLFLSWRSILKKYLGIEKRKPSKKNRIEVAGKKTEFMYYRVPVFSDETNAVCMATLRNLIRSPELLAAVIPIVVMAVLGAPYLMHLDGFEISSAFHPWSHIVVITVVMLSFPAFLFSMFSYDRDGFRAFVLSPIKRSDILLGKNVAIGIFTFISGALSLLVLQICIPFGWGVFVASILQLIVSYLAVAVIGNILSVCLPVGLKRGNMQPANAPVFHTILLYASVLLAPFLAVQPATFGCGIAILSNSSFTDVNPWIYNGLTILQLLIAVPVYWISLRFAGGLLWKNEPKIVNTVANLPE